MLYVDSRKRAASGPFTSCARAEHATRCYSSTLLVAPSPDNRGEDNETEKGRMPGRRRLSLRTWKDVFVLLSLSVTLMNLPSPSSAAGNTQFQTPRSPNQGESPIARNKDHRGLT